MGLDMYLNKVRKNNDLTMTDLMALEEYFGWENRGDDYKDCSLHDWCGIDIEDVPVLSIPEYRDEYINRYPAWDVEHRYGYPSIFDQVAYWRKANQIHGWFVMNVQNGNDDCGRYEVSKEHLEKLLNICETIYENCIMIRSKIKNGQRLENGEWVDILEDGWTVSNPELALELLPPTSGFFFGSSDINEWYMQDIKYTIDSIKKILATTDFSKETICYHSSW